MLIVGLTGGMGVGKKIDIFSSLPTFKKDYKFFIIKVIEFIFIQNNNVLYFL